jgi:hypothetical protein
MKTIFTTTALVAAILSGCSGGGLDVASVASVPVNTQLNSAVLTAAQSAQVSAALAKLTPDNAGDVLSELAALQAQVGFSTSLSQAVGVAQLVQAGIDSKAATALVASRGALSTLGQLVSYSLDASGKPSAAFEASLGAGSAALDNLVPPGVLVSDLTSAQQTEVGVASTVQTLRVMSAILGTGSLLSNQSTTEANTAITSNYSADRQAQLEAAAALLIETAAPAKTALSDGTAANNTTIDTLTTTLTDAMADRTISAAELQGIVAAMRARAI